MAKQGIGIKVGDIMTRNFVSVNPDTSLIDCAKEMIKKKVGSLILIKDKKLKGILIEKDIIWALTKKGKKDLSQIKAKDIVPRKTIRIRPSADLYEALRRMKKERYRWLPVVVKKNVIGLLTLKDIMRLEPTLLENAREIIRVKEESQKIKRREALVRGESWPRWHKEGMCEECGNFDVLYKVDNRMLCQACRDAM